MRIFSEKSTITLSLGYTMKQQCLPDCLNKRVRCVRKSKNKKLNLEMHIKEVSVINSKDMTTSPPVLLLITSRGVNFINLFR
jgi:hypothetical protein